MHHVYEDWLNRKSCDTLYYAENVSTELLDKTIKLISLTKTFPLYDLYIGKETNPLTITSAEQLYIITELQKMKTFSWPQTMFPSSKRVPLKEMASVFEITNQFSDEKWSLCSLIYCFSKPIFFRGRTICLYIDQATYSKTNSRIFIQFFQKINGNWEEYADVFTQLGKDQNRDAQLVDKLTDQVLQSQISRDPENGISANPETFHDFGKRIYSIFQSNKDANFSLLFPTLEERITLSNQMGVSTKIDTSNDYMKYNHMEMILKFNYDCRRILDKAKTLGIDWSNAIYSETKKTDIVLGVKNKDGSSKTITNLEVDFIEDNHKFKIELGGVFFINNAWKMVAISGPDNVE